MSTHLSDDSASAAAAAVVGSVDGGTLELWSGTMPGTTDGVPGGSLLAELDYADPAFGTPVNGVASALGVPLSAVGLPAAGAGTAVGFYRVCTPGGVTAWQNASVSTDGSTGLVLNTLTISEGVAVSILAHSYTQPTTT